MDSLDLGSKASSSTVREGDCTITISGDGLGPRNRSSIKAAARSDSNWSASRKSVVVALGKRL